jgi:hydrogenase maturation protease
MQPLTLILGIGNVLMTDEAVGVEVARRMARSSPAESRVRCIDGGTLSFTLAAPISECPRLIVVDAATMGAAPGSFRVFENAAMDHQLRVHAKSVHEVSLADLMDIARLTDTLPSPRALVGIEPAHVGWGDRLSPRVEAAIPVAIAAIQALLARWEQDATAL